MRDTKERVQEILELRRKNLRRDVVPTDERSPSGDPYMDALHEQEPVGMEPADEPPLPPIPDVGAGVEPEEFEPDIKPKTPDQEQEKKKIALFNTLTEVIDAGSVERTEEAVRQYADSHREEIGDELMTLLDDVIDTMITNSDIYRSSEKGKAGEEEPGGEKGGEPTGAKGPPETVPAGGPEGIGSSVDRILKGEKIEEVLDDVKEQMTVDTSGTAIKLTFEKKDEKLLAKGALLQYEGVVSVEDVADGLIVFTTDTVPEEAQDRIAKILQNARVGLETETAVIPPPEIGAPEGPPMAGPEGPAPEAGIPPEAGMPSGVSGMESVNEEKGPLMTLLRNIASKHMGMSSKVSGEVQQGLEKLKKAGLIQYANGYYTVTDKGQERIKQEFSGQSYGMESYKEVWKRKSIGETLMSSTLYITIDAETEEEANRIAMFLEKQNIDFELVGTSGTIFEVTMEDPDLTLVQLKRMMANYGIAVESLEIKSHKKSDVPEGFEVVYDKKKDEAKIYYSQPTGYDVFVRVKDKKEADAIVDAARDSPYNVWEAEEQNLVVFKGVKADKAQDAQNEVRAFLSKVGVGESQIKVKEYAAGPGAITMPFPTPGPSGMSGADGSDIGTEPIDTDEIAPEADMEEGIPAPVYKMDVPDDPDEEGRLGDVLNKAKEVGVLKAWVKVSPEGLGEVPEGPEGEFPEEKCKTPGRKIRSRGKGRGLARGKGRGPRGVPIGSKEGVVKEQPVKEGLESHANNILSKAGVVIGEDYGWDRSRLVVYDTTKGEEIANVLNKSGEFGPATYNEETEVVEIGVYQEGVVKEQPGDEGAVALECPECGFEWIEELDPEGRLPPNLECPDCGAEISSRDVVSVAYESVKEWITVKEMMRLCPSCAKMMKEKGISRVKTSWLKEQDDFELEPDVDMEPIAPDEVEALTQYIAVEFSDDVELEEREKFPEWITQETEAEEGNEGVIVTGYQPSEEETLEVPEDLEELPPEEVPPEDYEIPEGMTVEAISDDPAKWEKFWGSLVGDVKHKHTVCARKMKGKVDDPAAFCQSLKSKFEK